MQEKKGETINSDIEKMLFTANAEVEKKVLAKKAMNTIAHIILSFREVLVENGVPRNEVIQYVTTFITIIGGKQ